MGGLGAGARRWWQAARPKSFTATTTPVLVGLALALLEGHFSLLWAAITLVGVVSLQAGTNFLNDWFDHRTGADAVAHRQGDLLQQNLLPARAVLTAGLLCFLAGAVLGVAAVVHAGPLIWIPLGLGLLIGLTYTTGPLPLAYYGLGEVAVFVAMGLAIVLGTYVVQAGRFSPLALLAGIPVGLLVTAVIQANNLRDIEADAAVNKRTLAVRFGRGFARAEYAVLLLGAYVALPALGLADMRLALAGLPTLLTLPAALRLWRLAYATADPGELNRLLRGTAVLHGRFGWLWTAGLVVVAAVHLSGC